MLEENEQQQDPRELNIVNPNSCSADNDEGMVDRNRDDRMEAQPPQDSVDGLPIDDGFQLPPPQQQQPGSSIVHDDISDVTNLDVGSYVHSDMTSIVSAYAESVHSIPLAEEVANVMSKDELRARYDDLRAQFSRLCQHLEQEGETPTIAEETTQNSGDESRNGATPPSRPPKRIRKSARSRWILLTSAMIGFVILVVVIAVNSFADSPEQRAADLTDLLQSAALQANIGRTPTCDPNSTEVPDQMLCWLIHDDPLQLSVPQDTDHIIQRYALFVIILSQGHPTVSLAGNEHECDATSFNLWRAFWKCDDDGVLTEISAPDSGLGLSGTFPAEIGLLTQLTDLRFPNNLYSGQIPPSIGQLTQLTSLRFPHNNLNGTIPETIGHMTQLSFLYLEGNQLTGPMPASIGLLSNLVNLHIWNNTLTGTLPDTMRSLQSLRQLEVRENALSGSIPASFGELTLLDRLTLSRNQLTGTLPASLGNMSRVSTLWLHMNLFSGTFPSSLAQLEQPTHVLLYDNPYITGDMPFCSNSSSSAVPTTLVADCGQVHCPCCTQCCPETVDGIEFCAFCFCGFYSRYNLP